MTLRFGISSPVVHLFPGTPDWEVDATAADLRDIAAAADELGYEFLTCSEHVAIPARVAKVRGRRYHDAVATLGFFAGVTRRIKLLSHVIVVPYHHPLAIAKRFGTLDMLSDGRIILGVGVGSLEEEFDLLGAEFDGRGPRFVDALRALRASLGVSQPSYDGEFYKIDGFIIDPCALQAHMPMWIGGRTPRSLRRALALADGWVPFGLTPAQLGDMITRSRDLSEYANRSDPFEIALPYRCPIDLADNTQKVVDGVEELREAGATIVTLTVRASSAGHYRDQLARFREDVWTWN